jgi:hypothetical protein
LIEPLSGTETALRTATARIGVALVIDLNTNEERASILQNKNVFVRFTPSLNKRTPWTTSVVLVDGFSVQKSGAVTDLNPMAQPQIIDLALP